MLVLFPWCYALALCRPVGIGSLLIALARAIGVGCGAETAVVGAACHHRCVLLTIGRAGWDFGRCAVAAAVTVDRLIGVCGRGEWGTFAALVQRVSKFSARNIVLKDMYMHVVVGLTNPRVWGTTSAVFVIEKMGACGSAKGVEAHWGWRTIGIFDVGGWKAVAV